MRKIIVGVLLLQLSHVCDAAMDPSVLAAWTQGLPPKSVSFESAKRWKSGDPFTAKTRDGVLVGQVFQRFVDFGVKAVPVATATFLRVQKTGEWAKADVHGHEFSEAVRTLLGSPQWKTRRQGSSEVYEADWVSGNRFLKIFYRDRGTEVDISVATIRRIYGFPIVYETELLQRFLAGDRRVTQLFDFGLVSTAYAGDLNLGDLFPELSSPSPDLSNLIDASGLNTSLNNLGTSVTGAGNNIVSTIGTTGTTVSNTISTTGNNLAGAGNNIASSISTTGNGLAGAGNNIAASINTTGTNVTNTINGFSKTVSTTGTQVSGSMNNMASSINGMSDTIKQVASPRNAFLMGAAGVLGGMAAGAVVGIGVDLAEKATASIYYAVIGRLDPVTREKLKAKAGKAFDQFEELSKEISDTEKEIDLQIGALGLASNATGEDLATYAQMKVFDLEDQLHGGEDSLHQLTDPQARYACEEGLVDLANQENFYKEVQPVLSRAPDGLPGLCRDMNELFMRWAILESELDNARNSLLNKAQLFTADIADQVSDAYTPEASMRRQSGECNASVAKLQGVARDAEASRQSCVDDMSRIRGDDAANPDIKQQIQDYCLTQDQRNTTLEEQADQLASTCQQMRAVQEGVPADQAVIQGLTGAQLRLNSMRQFFEQLGQSACIQKTPSGACADGPNQFTLMKDRIGRKWDSAAQACPDLKKLERKDQDTASLAQTPKPKKKRGFIASALHWFWHAITSIF